MNKFFFSCRPPSVIRSTSSSPERPECKSEPISSPLVPGGKIARDDLFRACDWSVDSNPAISLVEITFRASLPVGGSLESIQSIDDCCLNSETEPRRHKSTKSRISSIQKLKQISGKVREDLTLLEKEETKIEVNFSSTPIEICVTEHETEVTENMDIKEDNIDNSNVDTFHSNITQSSEVEKKVKESPKEMKILEEPKDEAILKTETETPAISRKLEKKKRDDSLESTTASVKSSVQLSDTASLLSHRYPYNP